ncbi:MAG: homocysteine S-methyltransferase family protein [Clostridia bacterium]|nr:homocysteine S-methyltransferase family protein [Clostridia bacterium]
MSILELFGKKALVFDGAMGTMLQASGLKAGQLPETLNRSMPEAVLNVHRAYINAGADVISTNSFGANAVKLAPYGLDSESEVFLAVSLAKKAAEESDRKIFVAADIGPTGKLMPPLGDFSFEEAVNAFKGAVIGAQKAGADLIFFETFSDLYECKAAITAAKENTSLPVAVSLTFDENGRTLTGADAQTVAFYLSSVGADIIGVNCGLGPDAMEPIAIELASFGIPMIVNANAGLPKIAEDGSTYFDIAPSRFTSFAKNLYENGVAAVGGCCGTSPEYIKCVAEAARDKSIVLRPRKILSAVCSGTRMYTLGSKCAIVGERLNPTGKSKLKEALRNKNLDYLCNEAVAQQASDADILDVNVGIPEIDESEMLKSAVLAVQNVTDLPLQLDSADASALTLAARVYNGVPIINSVNGKEDCLDSILPIVKKCGGMCVALLLDENGIPDTAEGRLAIADKIIDRAKEYGIDEKRFLFDALTMTVATDEKSGEKTLECVKRLSERGLYTTLGVSNISFGMRNREEINASFLGAAVSRGLTAAIMNPSSESMKLVLSQEEPCPDFSYEKEPTGETAVSGSKKEFNLFDAVYLGLSAKAYELAAEALKVKKPLEVIESDLIPALNALGEDYESKKIFLPRLLGGAEAAKSAFKAVNQAMESSDEAKNGMKVVFATVHGDIHDIGKNIVVTLLSNYGFTVVDLGKDVPPKTILDAVIEHNASLLGLSALMTTTVPAMVETVRLVREHCPETKIMVGGAVLTKEYAETMGADFFGIDAMAAVRFAQSIDL